MGKGSCELAVGGSGWEGHAWSGWMPHCMEGGVFPQQGKEMGQVFLWEKEAFNYLHAFVASSAAHDASVSSFMYNLQVIYIFFLKNTLARPHYSGQQHQKWLYFCIFVIQSRLPQRSCPEMMRQGMKCLDVTARAACVS